MELFPHGLIARGGATVGYDVIGANLQHAPAGAQLAGHATPLTHSRWWTEN